MNIRRCIPDDRDYIRDLYLAAFPEEERETVAALAVSLLAGETSPETLTLVAELDGKIVGHVAFSPIEDRLDATLRGYLLAPLAVHPDFQKRGIGSELVASGLKQLADANTAIAFVYGDPQFYGRFGFETQLAERFTPPYTLEYPIGWQAKPIADPESLPGTASLSCVAALQDPSLW